MGMTIAEKILAAAAKRDVVKPGEIINAKIDLCMTNDATAHKSIDIFNNEAKEKKIFDKNKVVLVIDHNVPSESVETSRIHKKMRQFSKEYELDLYEGAGVCHQILVEDYVVPGQVVAAVDEHTSTYGALGTFAIQVSEKEFSNVLAEGSIELEVPATLKFNITGSFKQGGYARDLILKIIGDVGPYDLKNKVIEFSGDAVKEFTIDDRIVLCNLAVGTGALTAIVEADEKAAEYIKERGRVEKNIFKSDEDAAYEKIYNYNLGELEPVIARPDNMDDIVPLNSVEKVVIHEAFIGGCSGGRIEDLRIATQILKGKKIRPGMRLMISPASNEVYIKAVQEGIIDIFLESGATVMNPNCSTCWGAIQGVIGKDEVLISTGVRNFKGCCGDPSGKVYLASVATVAASAVAGEIVDSKKLS
jgi:homoaconitate hydratase family protein/3-isopropylmalate dehydratase, large subunit